MSMRILAAAVAVIVFPLVAQAGHQTCGNKTVGPDVSRCPDGSIPVYAADAIESGASDASQQGPNGNSPQDAQRSSSHHDAPPTPPRGSSLRRLEDLPEVDTTGFVTGLDAYHETPGVVIGKCSLRQCEVAHGMQTGQVDLTFAGDFEPIGGQTIFGVIIDTRHHIRDKRLVGIDASGHLSVGIPVGQLPAGLYEALFLTREQHAKPFARAIFKVSRGSSSSPARNQPKQQSIGVVGDWIGINGTAGKLTLRPDGKYEFNGVPGGSYSLSAAGVHFTGNLAAWNHGNATVKGDTMEFTWTNAQGASQWMVFARS